jgi:transposase
MSVNAQAETAKNSVDTLSGAVLSQRQAAKAAGVTTRTLRRWCDQHPELIAPTGARGGWRRINAAAFAKLLEIKGVSHVRPFGFSH